ncbi:thioredoxin family protein [Anaerococcus vaginalis]|uniref:thioredoxin family protein n=1 Tax=Anaerococcus vaginalis TaxID=33037 RepID=UPI002902F776|nr:thioredoxin family protein [Anaerococcus vaginalis]MDU2648173.1 thioredoxin family protein [Anaerococcus vaginalis]
MQIVDYKISKEFLKKILVDNKKIIALFHANWSSSSNLMKINFLKEEEDSYKNIKKMIIDIDKNRELIKKLGINQIPSLVSITKDSLNENDFIINSLRSI